MSLMVPTTRAGRPSASFTISPRPVSHRISPFAISARYSAWYLVPESMAALNSIATASRSSGWMVASHFSRVSVSRRRKPMRSKNRGVPPMSPVTRSRSKTPKPPAAAANSRKSADLRMQQPAQLSPQGSGYRRDPDPLELSSSFKFKGQRVRTVKVLAGVMGGILVLIAAGLVAVWWLVNPNDYKGRIAAAVKESTGRELVLQGDIKLSVFPWIALELGPASLGNPPGFPEQPFVSFQHASVRVELLPLLSKRLEVGRVELDGLDLKLLKNGEGKGNWEGFCHTEGTPPAAAPAKGGGGALQGIEGIKVTNARMTYENLTLTYLNLETGAFAARHAVPVTLHVDAERGPAERGAAEHATSDGGPAEHGPSVPG